MANAFNIQSGNANILPGFNGATDKVIAPENQPNNVVQTLPSAAVTPATTGSGGSGGGSSTPAITPVSTATINAIMQSIANQVATNNGQFTNAQTSNTGADAVAENTHTQQVITNNQAHDTAIQNAEQAAAQGNQGLQAILASMGALGGTGQVLAGRAVANSANNDIGTAGNTYTANNQAISDAEGAAQQARQERDLTLENNLTADNQDANAKGIQTILNAASTQGDQATYNRFLPQLVNATSAPVALQPTAVAYNSAPTSSYSAPGNVAVQAAPAATSSTTPVNSALYVTKQS
jgi:hypothetical protein